MLTVGDHSSASDGNNMSQQIAYHDKLELKTFQYNDHNSPDPEYDTDPENIFFNINDKSCNYNEEQYKHTIMDNKLSIIHFNKRDTYAKFNNVKAYLKQFTKLL